MIEIKRTNTIEEFENGVLALTEIFIDEYPYYATWIRKNLNQFKTGEKQILQIKSNMFSLSENYINVKLYRIKRKLINYLESEGYSLEKV